MTAATLVIVDGANVVGSVPNGWWRDREGANRRLRDELVSFATTGFAAGAAPAGVADGPVEVTLVVEGAARSVESVAGVHVVAASGSGDDAIVELVQAEATTRPCVVITADRELRNRVTSSGGVVAGRRAIRGS